TLEIGWTLSLRGVPDAWISVDPVFADWRVHRVPRQPRQRCRRIEGNRVRGDRWPLKNVRWSRVGTRLNVDVVGKRIAVDIRAGRVLAMCAKRPDARIVVLPTGAERHAGARGAVREGVAAPIRPRLAAVVRRLQVRGRPRSAIPDEEVDDATLVGKDELTRRRENLQPLAIHQLVRDRNRPGCPSRA